MGCELVTPPTLPVKAVLLDRLIPVNILLLRAIGGMGLGMLENRVDLHMKGLFMMT